MELDAAQYPINQRIVAGEPAVSQDLQAIDIQWSYIERSVLNFTRGEANWQIDCITDNNIGSSVEELERDQSNTKGSELVFRDEGTINKTMCGARVHQGNEGD